ncbi:MAG: hypothetical protein Q9M13_07985, partial [Mariprofundales bacterium]|nr:hypothetical protein [Mariprofundales bacterium]
ADASTLYARNMLSFIGLLTNSEGSVDIDVDDEIIAATLLCRRGEFVQPRFLSPTAGKSGSA